MVRSIPGYFARWADARKRLAWIHARMDEGRTVYLVSALKATRLTAKHRMAVRAIGRGLEVQHGTRWIDYSHVALRAD